MKVRRVSSISPVRGRSVSLVPGQLVHGRIISKINPGLFRVGAAGQVFVAASDLPLQKGQRLTARVEMGDSKIFLRIFEDNGRGATEVYDLADPDEVRRILIGLGHKPDQTVITEFQERLDRYRTYGHLPGAEPSDVWILALLWTRGIRGGADAYALLSYYLRQATYRKNILPSPEKMADLIANIDKLAVETDADRENESRFRKASTEDESAEYVAERRSEARTLLNRNNQEAGIFTHDMGADHTNCVLCLRKEAKDLIRWTDNPTLPMLILESVRSQGRVQTRIHKLISEESSQRTTLNRWISNWEARMQEADLELENMEVMDAEDTEYLRFMFWRKWEPDQVRDAIA